MNYTVSFSILIPAIVAIASWWVIHFLTLKRDRTNKRQELRVKYLIEVYRNLEGASNRQEGQPELNARIESAITDIQLFGSATQIRLAKTFADQFVRSNSVRINELLEELRRDLRKELLLEPPSERLSILRIGAGEKPRPGN